MGKCLGYTYYWYRGAFLSFFFEGKSWFVKYFLETDFFYEYEKSVGVQIFLTTCKEYGIIRLC